MFPVTSRCWQGGGLFISSRDHARFGLLHLRNGLWEDQRLIPEGWTDVGVEPSPTNHQYGAMWWLNTDGEKGRMYPAAPPTSYTAQGAGGNYIWIDPILDLVVVVRWCGNFVGFVEAVMYALEPPLPKL